VLIIIAVSTLLSGGKDALQLAASQFAQDAFLLGLIMTAFLLSSLNFFVYGKRIASMDTDLSVLGAASSGIDDEEMAHLKEMSNKEPKIMLYLTSLRREPVYGDYIAAKKYLEKNAQNMVAAL